MLDSMPAGTMPSLSQLYCINDSTAAAKAAALVQAATKKFKQCSQSVMLAAAVGGVT